MYLRTDDGPTAIFPLASDRLVLPVWPGLGEVLVDFDPKREAEFGLGETKRGRSIVARYFPGTRLTNPKLKDRRALVIAGVHGSELSGIEVAQRLVQRLEKGPAPRFSVLVIPELFPDNAAVAREAPKAGKLRPGSDSILGRATKGSTDPNRQFPPPGSDFVLDPTDPKQKAIDPENKILLQLIQEFRPDRIA